MISLHHVGLPSKNIVNFNLQREAESDSEVVQVRAFLGQNHCTPGFIISNQ